MRGLSLVVLLVPAVAFAGDPKAPAPPAKDAKPAPAKPPGEVDEIVAAFKGTWTFDAKITGTKMPGMDKPLTAKMTFSCKPVAGNAAVECDAKTKTAMGPYDGSFFIAYDPYSKSVHFMGVTSKYEVSDHKCTLDHGMAGKFGIQCEPNKHGSGATGDEITNEIGISFHDQGKTADFRSVSTFKNGSTLTFEGTGKR